MNIRTYPLAERRASSPLVSRTAAGGRQRRSRVCRWCQRGRSRGGRRGTIPRPAGLGRTPLRGTRRAAGAPACSPGASPVRGSPRGALPPPRGALPPPPPPRCTAPPAATRRRDRDRRDTEPPRTSRRCHSAAPLGCRGRHRGRASRGRSPAGGHRSSRRTARRRCTLDGRGSRRFCGQHQLRFDSHSASKLTTER